MTLLRRLQLPLLLVLAVAVVAITVMSPAGPGQPGAAALGLSSSSIRAGTASGVSKARPTSAGTYRPHKAVTAPHPQWVRAYKPEFR